MVQAHDNKILSYEIHLKDEKIILHTEYTHKDIYQLIDFVFTGVFTHFFEGQLPGSIILDISTNDITTFFNNQENIDLLKEKKKYGWPADYESIDDLKQTLVTNDFQYYELSSSYGLNGWIIAKNYCAVHISDSCK